MTVLHPIWLALVCAFVISSTASAAEAEPNAVDQTPADEQAVAEDTPGEKLDETLANEINHLDYLFTPGHVFPLFGTHPYIAEGLPPGVKPPLPYGLTPGIFVQTQDIQLTDFRINSVDVAGIPIDTIPEFFPLLAGLTNVEVDIPNELVQKSIRADAWLLPILNVFALYGEVEGDVSVDIKIPEQSLIPGGPLADLLGGVATIPQIDIPLFDVQYFGEAVGYGYTVALGYKRFFMTWTEVETTTDLDSDQGFTIQSDSIVLNPRAGWIWTPWLTTWVGGLHLEVTKVAVQSNGNDFLGDLDLLQNLPVVGGPVGDLLGNLLETVPVVNEAVALDFEVTLVEEQPWNYLAGALINVGPNIAIEFEAGWGVREYWLAGLGVRF
ncbi:MAG: hypothetical protein OXT49_05575 [Gammaproteobacteria bacterium]|nr:hypothetical protein [Gammaproteobacteria bacterium]